MLKNVSSTGPEYFDPSLTAALSNTPIILYDSGFTSYTTAGANLEVVTYTAAEDCVAFLYIVTSNTGNTSANYAMARVNGTGAGFYDHIYWHYVTMPEKVPQNSSALNRHNLYICATVSNVAPTDPRPNYGFVIPTGGKIIGRLSSYITSGAKGHMRLICTKADPVSFLHRYTR